MTLFWFRVLLVAALALGLFGAAVDSVFPSLVPEPLSVALKMVDRSISNTSLFAILSAGVAVLALGLVCTVGLYRCRPWARTLGVCTTVFAFVASAFAGPFVMSGVASACAELSSTLWGAALVCAYFSPVARAFSRDGD